MFLLTAWIFSHCVFFAAQALICASWPMLSMSGNVYLSSKMKQPGGCLTIMIEASSETIRVDDLKDNKILEQFRAIRISEKYDPGTF